MAGSLLYLLSGTNNEYPINATICFSRRFDARLCSPRLDTPHRCSTQRFVFHSAPQQYAARRPSTPLNDLFFTTLRPAAIRIAPLLNSTICFLRRYAAYGSAPLRTASQLHSTICFLPRPAPHLCAPCRIASLCCSTQLNDLFFTTPRSVSRRIAPHHNSTQRFVFYAATSPCRAAPCRAAPCRASPQLNDLFVTTSPQRHAAHGISTLLNSTRRNR